MRLLINTDNITLNNNYREIDPNKLENIIHNNLFCDYDYYYLGKGSIFMDNRYKHISNNMVACINWSYPINRSNPIQVYISIYKIVDINQDILHCIGTVKCTEQLLKNI